MRLSVFLQVICFLAAMLYLTCNVSLKCYAQSPVDQAPTPEIIQRYISQLSEESFRARELARWHLQRAPALVLVEIRECLGKADYHTATELLDLVSRLALDADISISVPAREILRTHSNRISAIGQMADNAVRAIADLQETQAFEVLTHFGARIDSSQELGINLNAREVFSDEVALRIDGGLFRGDDDAIAWIQFLKSVEIIYFEGAKIDSRFFRAIANLPNVKSIKLKHLSVSAADLEVLKNFHGLELLELSYVDVGDDILDTLSELPISQALRLFGTKITRAGAERLSEQLDGIDIYCGLGGHLGVATGIDNTVVQRVVAGSGADYAGIRLDDELTSIEGVEINTFEDLRAELGKFAAGDKVKIALLRKISTLERIELEVIVTLGEDLR